MLLTLSFFDWLANDFDLSLLLDEALALIDPAIVPVENARLALTFSLTLLSLDRFCW